MSEKDIIRCPEEDEKLHKLLKKALIDDKWYGSVEEAVEAMRVKKVGGQNEQRSD